jgi:hypothetical protein
MVCGEEVVVYAFCHVRLLKEVVQQVLHHEGARRCVVGRGAGFNGDSSDTAESVNQLHGDRLNHLLCAYRTAGDIV